MDTALVSWSDRCEIQSLLLFTSKFNYGFSALSPLLPIRRTPSPCAIVYRLGNGRNAINTTTSWRWFFDPADLCRSAIRISRRHEDCQTFVNSLLTNRFGESERSTVSRGCRLRGGEPSSLLHHSGSWGCWSYDRGDADEEHGAERLQGRPEARGEQMDPHASSAEDRQAGAEVSSHSKFCVRPSILTHPQRYRHCSIAETKEHRAVSRRNRTGGERGLALWQYQSESGTVRFEQA